ncbi:transposase [Wenjunlia vitaminophila]|uniref:transposase n=1 Tax=Wenjunlia vitaminophila TaxID=76728 RepID=UPI000368174E|nr:transposase [Wenjunlia vitaminophila]
MAGDGHHPAVDLVERRRQAPVVQVQLVTSIRATIRALDAAIADAVASHPYAPLLATTPRIGTINLGQLTGEIGPILERSRTSEQFTAGTGVVPVTRASGKSRVVSYRHAANHRARLAIVGYAARILARAWLRVMWACWRDGTCYDPRHPPSQQQDQTRSRGGSGGIEVDSGRSQVLDAKAFLTYGLHHCKEQGPRSPPEEEVRT